MKEGFLDRAKEKISPAKRLNDVVDATRRLRRKFSLQAAVTHNLQEALLSQEEAKRTFWLFEARLMYRRLLESGLNADSNTINKAMSINPNLDPRGLGFDEEQAKEITSLRNTLEAKWLGEIVIRPESDAPEGLKSEPVAPIDTGRAVIERRVALELPQPAIIGVDKE